MSGATQLLDTLHGLGVKLRAAGEMIGYRPADVVTPELLTAIRRHKAELLALLHAGDQPAGTTDSLDASRWVVSDPLGGPLVKACCACHGTRWWRLRLTGCDWVCARCHPPGPPPDWLEWRDGATETRARLSAAQRLERAIDEALASVGADVAAGIDRADWRERYEERAAIHEHDGGMPRDRAEELALEAAVSALRERLGPDTTVAATVEEVASG